MSALVSAPGTPPELTESQSSGPSSYASELSSPDESFVSNMHFEEIILDVENNKPEKVISARGIRAEQCLPKQHSAAERPALATLQTQQTNYHASREKGVRSAATPVLKRTFTKSVPSSQSNQTLRANFERPTLHKTTSASKLGQFAHTPATLLAVPGRRGSWQPMRRTTCEIEAEYHDSDDELPEDASLYNVPLSPFIGRARIASVSPRPSVHGSPERDSPAASPAPIPLSHFRTAPNEPPGYESSKTLPRKRRMPTSSSNQLAHPKSASPSPRIDMRYGRTKSWNLVMADLDHEARVVAEKLDFHHEALVKLDAAAANPHRSSAPGAIPLPSIQRGTLDFLPTSKEKEAVLSRTRPSWLPPKDPREEKRHLEEYKKMMKASVEADKRREQKAKQNYCRNDSTRDSILRIWTYYVEPSTDVGTIDCRVNDLCWRGVPAKVRGAVWQRRVGNALGLTKQSYQKAVEQVKETKSKPIEKLSEYERSMQEWFANIERDAETAFPDISMFKKNGPQWRDLIDVCEAYASYRADIGYVYGMQLVAALILLQLLDPAEAFILMANCLNKAMPLAFQSGDINSTSRAYSKVKSTLNIKFPQLHAYLFNGQEDGGLGFTGDELFENMFRTVFTNGLDLDRLCRVWDIWIFEGDRYLVRTAIALLGTLQSQIFETQGDLPLRRRNIQEMLGWGPFGRTSRGYWMLDSQGNGDSFVEAIRDAGQLDCADK